MTNTPQAYSAAAEVGQIRERRTWVQIAKIELKKAPYSAWFGLIVIAIYLFVAIFAPLLAPHGEAEIFPASFAPVSYTHLTLPTTPYV